jgi:prepilin-type N-terminal cleavage/methylation domain-containing protein
MATWSEAIDRPDGRGGRARPDRGAGYSLPELLIVVALIGIFVLFGGPAMNEAYRSYKIRTTANGLVNDLRAQRYLAVANRAPRTLTINRQDHPSEPNQYSFVNPQGRAVTMRVEAVDFESASATSVPFTINGGTGTSGNLTVLVSGKVSNSRGERYTITITPTGTVQAVFSTYTP